MSGILNPTSFVIEPKLVPILHFLKDRTMCLQPQRGYFFEKFR